MQIPKIFSIVMLLLLRLDLFAYDLYTAARNGNYYSYALAAAKGCAIPLDIKPSKGSIDNIKQLLRNPRGSFALVQSDVYTFYHSISPKEMARITFAKPLRHYQERLYILKNSKMPPFADTLSLHDKNLTKKLKPIAIGSFGSGSSITGFMILDANHLTHKARYLAKEEALDRLLNKEISLIFYVGRHTPHKNARWIDEVLRHYGKYITLITLDPRDLTLDAHSSLPRIPTLLISTVPDAKINERVYRCFE